LAMALIRRSTSSGVVISNSRIWPTRIDRRPASPFRGVVGNRRDTNARRLARAVTEQGLAIIQSHDRK
jgi:hypothetical protein